MNIKTIILCGISVALAAPIVTISLEASRVMAAVDDNLAQQKRPLDEGWLITDDNGDLWFCSLNESAWWRYDPVRKAWHDAHIARPNGIGTRVRCYTSGRITQG